MRRALPILLTLAAVLLATLPLRAEEPAAPEPAPKVDDAAIKRLVDDLGSSDFAQRERASRELLALGERARPALEQTMKNSENMEARWRAEQILRRMDREGERPMGQGDERLRPRAVPPGAPGGMAPPPGMEDLERLMEERRKRFFGGFGPPSFGDFGPSSERFETPGLRLDAEVFAGMLIQVTLLDRESGRAYRGRTLEDVLARNPELDELEGMAKLKEKWAAYKVANPSLGRSGATRLSPGSGFSFTQSSRGVQITHGPDGVTVRIREKDENGKDTVREVKGATLDEIKEKHPELREQLEGFNVGLQMGPIQIFRGRSQGGRLPVPPAPPKAETTPSEEPLVPMIFGVRLVEPEAVLAVHLGLEPGHGALVTQVIPGTQAAQIGLERHDVILAVNGEPVANYRQAVTLLRAAGEKRAPVKLSIIRRGQRTTLER